MDEQLKTKLALGMERARKTSSKKANKSTTTHHSAPITTTLSGNKPSLNRFDTERLLSQMGMADITEEDYCIEVEFSRRRSSGHDDPVRKRCHSYDCNYPNQSLEHAFENFGVERQLVELSQSPGKTEGRDRKKQTGRARSMAQVVGCRLFRNM
jgi:hypothetical protein